MNSKDIGGGRLSRDKESDVTAVILGVSEMTLTRQLMRVSETGPGHQRELIDQVPSKTTGRRTISRGGEMCSSVFGHSTSCRMARMEQSRRTISLQMMATSSAPMPWAGKTN